MPLDHTTLLVPASSVDAVVSFLTASLSHAGFREHMRPAPNVVGCGETTPYLWIVGVDGNGDGNSASQQAFSQQLRRTHIAFAASGIQQVQTFHAEALKAGGEDNGAPGRRAQYHPGYYAAFVRDPACGVNFEMVFHGCPVDGF